MRLDARLDRRDRPAGPHGATVSRPDDQLLSHTSDLVGLALMGVAIRQFSRTE